MIKLYYRDIESVFERAVLNLVENHDARTVGDVSRWFKMDFNGYVFYDQLFNWEYVVFPKDEDASMFMLRFS